MAAMLLLSVSGFAQTTFTKVTSASGLEAGANYLIVAHYDDLGVLAMGNQKTNNRNAVIVSENGDAITVTPGTDPSSETDVFQFTLGGSANAWTLFDEVKGGYLYAASSSSNNLKTQTSSSMLTARLKWLHKVRTHVTTCVSTPTPPTTPRCLAAIPKRQASTRA